MIALELIDWCIGQPAEGDYWPKIALCDLCYEDVCTDFRDEKEPRQFFRQNGGIDDGLVVCENCLPAFLSEDKS